jgi:hypothetical protein
MRNSIVAVSIAALLFAVACKSKKKTTPPPPEIAVTLIDPGQTPREPLVYSIPRDTALKSLLTVEDLEVDSDAPPDATESFTPVRLSSYRTAPVTSCASPRPSRFFRRA